MKEPRKPKTLGLLERKRLDRAERRRKKRIRATIVISVLAVVGIAVSVQWRPWQNFSWGDLFRTKEEQPEKDDEQKEEGQTANERQELIDAAEIMAASYGYDEAIEMLTSIEGYKKDREIQNMIEDMEDEKASCVPVNLDEVTHIFYQSLVVDEERAFANQDNDPQAASNNQWMTTLDEFQAITQEMYNRGYVLVSIHDLYEVTEGENGEEVWEPARLLLPEGKKAFVMSIDDVSYYHSYDGYGLASKLVLDENGDVMNEYVDAEGNTHIGAYDCISLLDQFIKEHPDASYKGAKGIIALTGYNGILGYRTDVTYDLSHENCDESQREWIKEHPEFDLETERAEAKKIAEVLKENGWEFANHTWGHIRVADKSLESIRIDTEKWKENVEPLIGETDIIVFAHSQDIEDVGAYSASNEKYQYYREQGYQIFCNITSNNITNEDNHIWELISQFNNKFFNLWNITIRNIQSH